MSRHVHFTPYKYKYPMLQPGIGENCKDNQNLLLAVKYSAMSRDFRKGSLDSDLGSDPYDINAIACLLEDERRIGLITKLI